MSTVLSSFDLKAGMKTICVEGMLSWPITTGTADPPTHPHQVTKRHAVFVPQGGYACFLDCVVLTRQCALGIVAAAL